MKKALIFIAIAVFAFASCTKDSLGFDNRVMVLLPSGEGEYRWEQDYKYITEALGEYNVRIIAKVADITDGGEAQLQQFAEGLKSGIQNYIITPVDYNVFNETKILEGRENLNILCHDRMIYNNPSIDFFSSCDNFDIGVMQGQFIIQNFVASGKKSATIELFAGPTVDNNAIQFYQGAMSCLQPYITSGALKVPSGLQSYEEVALPSWEAVDARQAMTSRLNESYSEGNLPDYILAPADYVSIGCVEAIKKLYPGQSKYPVITGQDATDIAIEFINLGMMSMTIDKSLREMAYNSANSMYALMNGTVPPTASTFDNGVKEVPLIKATPKLVIGSY